MTENKIWEKIEVPQELDDIIRNAVGEGHEKMRKKRREKHWKRAVVSVTAAAACFAAVGIGFFNPVVARAYSSIPVIGNIFAYLYHTADVEIPYAQVGEAAVPVESGQKSSLIPEGAADKETSAQISLKEYFCDKYSLYLSFEITSQAPFIEGMTDLKGREGTIQLFSAEKLTTDTKERFEIGDGSLIIKGVFTDAHTFVGIARSGESLDEYSLTDEVQYELDAKHMKVYAGEGTGDIIGEWKLSEGITCTEEYLLTKELGQKIRDDVVLAEVRVQPYEIQVVIEEPKDTTLAEEAVGIEIFDDQGRRLSLAAQSACRFAEEGEKRLEIWMFERPADAETVTVFAVDEIKWMDEWKGYLYREDPWSGARMADFLKENSFAYGEAELP